MNLPPKQYGLPKFSKWLQYICRSHSHFRLRSCAGFFLLHHKDVINIGSHPALFRFKFQSLTCFLHVNVENDADEEFKKKRLEADNVPQSAKARAAALQRHRLFLKEEKQRQARADNNNAYFEPEYEGGPRIMKPTIYCSSNGKPPPAARKIINVRVRDAVERHFPDPLTVWKGNEKALADQRDAFLDDVRSAWENGNEIGARFLFKKMIRRLEV